MFFQKFNFSSNILKDISKVCSLEINNVKKIISEINFEISEQNMYLEKKYFNDDNFRKISLKHIIEIASARIEEITNILFNQNNNLNYLKNKDIPIYLDFTDKNISNNFKKYFKSYLDKYNLKIDNLNDDDPIHP